MGMRRSANRLRQHRSQVRGKYGPKLLDPGWRGAHDPNWRHRAEPVKGDRGVGLDTHRRRLPRQLQLSNTRAMQQRTSMSDKTNVFSNGLEFVVSINAQPAQEQIVPCGTQA